MTRMTTDTNTHVRPEPREASWPRTVRDAADREAGEYARARGWDITGHDVLTMYANLQAAIARELGRACMASGRVPARGSRLS